MGSTDPHALALLALRRLTRHLDRTALVTLLYGYAGVAIACVVGLIWALSNLEPPSSWHVLSTRTISRLEVLFAVSLVLALRQFVVEIAEDLWDSAASPTNTNRDRKTTIQK